MTREKVVDEIADDGIWFVSEFCDNAADERAAAAVPLEIDRAMYITRTVNFGPAMRAARLFGPNLDEAKFLLQLRIAHDFRPQRSLAGRDDLNQRLHDLVRFGGDGNFATLLKVAAIHRIAMAAR